MARSRNGGEHKASKLKSRKQSKRPDRSKRKASAKKRALLDSQLQEGARQVRIGKSVAAAARSAGISPKRLSRFLTKNRIARRVGGRWLFYKRGRRQMRTFSEGQIPDPNPTFNPAEAGYNGEFLSAVGQFRKTNDPAHLAPFVGKSVKDIEGREYPFETRPNVLHRLLAGTEPTDEIYRIQTQ